MYACIKKICLPLFIALLFYHNVITAIIEKLIAVVVPSYNNAEWYENNLSSIFMQDYENYYVIYIDDCSTDGTYELVCAYIEQHNQAHRCVLIKNGERQGHLFNHIQAISMLENHAIVVHIDGDDWLRLDEYKRTDIFTLLNTIYEDPNVWLTYGSYYRYPFGNVGVCRPFSSAVVQNNDYRDFEWVSSHLRTFYAWLFKQIDPLDFLYTGDNEAYRGALWPAAADLSFMFPMLEMAAGKFFYIEDVIYAYNRANPINLCTGDRLPVQQECARLIRVLPRYAPVDNALFWYYMAPYRMKDVAV
jgi:glycosyltransferase involved in cell wall biosynthesis